MGIAALAASTTLLALASAPWQVYLAFILMSFGWIGMGTVVIATILSLWFVRRRGLAISLAFTGASSGGVVVTPLLVFLVERFGFSVHRMALLEPKIGRASAGLAVSVLAFMAIAGRLGLGMVVDRFDPRLVTAASLVSQAAALLTIRQTDSVPIALGACAVFGF